MVGCSYQEGLHEGGGEVSRWGRWRGGGHPRQEGDSELFGMDMSMALAKGMGQTFCDRLDWSERSMTADSRGLL